MTSKIGMHAILKSSDLGTHVSASSQLKRPAALPHALPNNLDESKFAERQDAGGVQFLTDPSGQRIVLAAADWLDLHQHLVEPGLHLDLERLAWPMVVQGLAIGCCRLGVHGTVVRVLPAVERTARTCAVGGTRVGVLGGRDLVRGFEHRCR